MKFKINTFILLSYHWLKINNNLKYIDESLELYIVEICVDKYLQING